MVTDGDIYHDCTVVQYGNAPLLMGKTVNAAARAALQAINDKLPVGARTVGNFKGIIKDCEELLDNTGFVGFMEDGE